MNVIPETRHLH